MKTTLKKLVSRVGNDADQGIEERKKGILLNLFFYFYFLVAAGFIVFNLAVNNTFALTVDVFGFACGLFLYYLFRVRRMVIPVAWIFVVVTVTLMTFLILSGGMSRNELVFALLVPVPVILLLGRRNGLIVLSVFLFLNFMGFVLFQDDSWFPDYDLKIVCRIVIVFVLVALMAYANEFVFGVLYQGLEKLSASLRVSQQRYKNLAGNKEKFVSLISHSLADHIGKFASTASLLHDEYDGMSEQRRKEAIRDLVSVSHQNRKLLDDLLHWATVQSDTIPFHPKPVKLEKIYREVIELFHPLIEEKKLSFFLKMKSNSEIVADENMVGAIMRGLVSNAIKFSFPGGEVRISAREAQDRMVVTVTDKGAGMSEEDLLRINASLSFSTEGTMMETGTGIGLILVKEFLQKHGGDFHVESRKGKGTEVTFTLPLAE